MIGLGLLAGAAGTMALDTYTYADILASARPQSSLPATVVQKLAQIGDVESLAADDEPAANRRTGAGALMGYGVGLGGGVVYALVRPAFQSWLPWPIAGLLLGASTLVLSEGTATRLGATDWSTWTPSEWAADVIPRSLYGLVTAYVVERLSAPVPGDSRTGDASVDTGELGTTFVDDPLSEPDPDFPVVPEPESAPDEFDRPIVPGRETAVAPLDPVAIEADREINPRFS